MKRNVWEFPYTADKLLEAAKDKVKHHSQRLSWWEAKKTEVTDTVKSEGIEIDESVSDLTSNSYFRGATVNIRNDLVKDLQECVSKIQEHRGKLSEYEAWVEVLASQGQASVALQHDDWLFFFSKA